MVLFNSGRSRLALAKRAAKQKRRQENRARFKGREMITPIAPARPVSSYARTNRLPRNF